MNNIQFCYTQKVKGLFSSSSINTNWLYSVKTKDIKNLNNNSGRVKT